MDSDDFLEDDIDPECFAQLDAIEAAHYGPIPTAQASTSTMRSLAREDSFCDLSFDVDEEELQLLDDFVDSAFNGFVLPVVQPVRRTPKSSRRTIQTTLFGDTLPSSTSSSRKLLKPRSPIKRTKSTQHSPFGRPASKTKQWDHTAFSKSGLKRGKSKDKKKVKEGDGQQDEDEEVIEFEQFPAPFVSGQFISLRDFDQCQA